MVDLSEVNKILDEIASSDPRISPVTLDDYALFQRFFDKEDKHTYGNSWTYVTQGVYGVGPNNLGYKYYDGDRLSIVALYPRIENPNVDMFYWIRPMGRGVEKIISDYSDSFLRKYNSPTYAKKLFSDQYEKFLELGFYSADVFPWHSSAIKEDDSFPEIIIDKDETLKQIAELPRRSSLKRGYLNRQSIINSHDVSFRDSVDHEMKGLIEKFFTSDHIIHGKSNLSSPEDYYNMVENPSPNRVSKTVYIDGQPEGFFVGEYSSDGNYFSVYALITLRGRVNQLSDCVIVYLLNNVESRYINLGGSEDEGIDRFKRKYLPASELQMHWVTNVRASADNSTTFQR